MRRVAAHFSVWCAILCSALIVFATVTACSSPKPQATPPPQPASAPPKPDPPPQPTTDPTPAIHSVGAAADQSFCHSSRRQDSSRAVGLARRADRPLSRSTARAGAGRFYLPARDHSAPAVAQEESWPEG